MPLYTYVTSDKGARACLAGAAQQLQRLCDLAGQSAA